jgi:glycosyltransferase involved in cell wall biosynthesis
MSHPIRLLRVARIRNDRLGGMSRTMYETGDHLQQMGFEVDYLFEESFSRRIHRGMRRFTNPWEALGLVRRRCAEREACDLVELHEPLTFGAGMVKRLVLSGAKVVGFSYGLEHRDWPLHVEFRRRYGVPLGQVSRASGALQAWQSLMGLKLCDHVVCSNREDVEYLERAGIARNKLTLHHSGVNESLLAAGEGELSRSSRRMLYLGNWIHRKGVVELAAAFQRLVREHEDVCLTIAGSREAEEPILRHFDPGCRHAIKVIPYVDSDSALAEILSANDVLVLPSHFEGQPLVMMEAAAFGLAIVTTATCGMLDFVRDGENGLLVPPGDADALHGKLKMLVEDPQQRVRLGGAARECVAAYTWKRSAENLAQSYRALVLEGTKEGRR